MYPTETTSTRTNKGKGFLTKPWKHPRFFPLLLQTIGATVLIVVLYYQLFEHPTFNLTDWWALFAAQFTWKKMPLLLLVVVLMPVNWLLETKKWMALLRPLSVVPMKRALRVVLIGLAGSLFTPNRIGEYGGRLLLLPKAQRHQALYATLLGAFSQWLVLIVLGAWAWTGVLWSGWLSVSSLLRWSVTGTTILGTVLLLTVYQHSKAILQWLVRRPRWQRWTQGVADTPFECYTPTLMLRALSYAGIRSLTYSLQYVGLLCFFGYDVPLLLMLLGVLLVYGIQTGLPLPPSTGLLARGNVALLIFGWLQPTAIPLSILAATFGLWLLNVVLPALLGGWYMVHWDGAESGATTAVPVGSPIAKV